MKHFELITLFAIVMAVCLGSITGSVLVNNKVLLELPAKPRTILTATVKQDGGELTVTINGDETRVKVTDDNEDIVFVGNDDLVRQLVVRAIKKGQ